MSLHTEPAARISLHLHPPCGMPEKKSPGENPGAFLFNCTDVALEMLYTNPSVRKP